jgi:hypothetical protein
VAIATGHRPLFAPGKRFSYSNSNYILAGLVIERVTGQRLATQLQQRIFGPLDLDATELPVTEQTIARPHVNGYAPRDQDWQVTDGPAGLLDVTEMDPSWAWAAGAMVSSTADLAHFYQALLGGRLLDPELLQAMQTTVDASDQLGHGAGYGLGLMLLRPGCATEVWGHGGALAGYRTTAFSTKNADRQLVATTNLNPEPTPGQPRRPWTTSFADRSVASPPPSRAGPPVHHFWHTFDITHTRFSDCRIGQPATADSVTREAYSREVISFGFWFGDDASLSRRSTPTPPRSRSGWPRSPWSRRLPGGIPATAATWPCCDTTPAPPTIPGSPCWSSTRAPTRPAPAWPVGTSGARPVPAGSPTRTCADSKTSRKRRHTKRAPPTRPTPSGPPLK